MKKINLNFSDAEECISVLRSLTEGFRDDADYVRKLALSGKISGQKSEDILKLLLTEAETAESCAGYLTKAADECERTEEKVLMIVRKSVSEHQSSIVVEKSKTPVRGSLVSGRTVKHDGSLAALAMKKRAGESV